MDVTCWRKIARDSNAWKLILKDAGMLHGPYNQWRSNVISPRQTFCTSTLLLSEVCVQWPTWLFSVVPWWCAFRVESSWNVMAQGDAREGKWRWNWRMEWVASTLHTTSEHGVSSITAADAHTSAASSRLNWRLRRFKWARPFRPKDEMWFLRACHHVSNAAYVDASQSKKRYWIVAYSASVC